MAGLAGSVCRLIDGGAFEESSDRAAGRRLVQPTFPPADSRGHAIFSAMAEAAFKAVTF